MGEFSGRVAPVTGGGGGIGRAAALAFANKGAAVFVSDSNGDTGAATTALVRQAGGRSEFFEARVDVDTEAEAMVRSCVAAFDRLDFAFNNAGVGTQVARTHEFSEFEWDRIMSVNLKGVWLCMKYEIAQMLDQGSGVIVNTASGAGLWGVPFASGYAASKHGVVGLTRTAALEYARDGIRINAVCPGFVRTPMLGKLIDDTPGLDHDVAAEAEPMGRIAEPEEIAEVAVWLCTPEARFMTGVPLPVDGGLSAGR